MQIRRSDRMRGGTRLDFDTKNGMVWALTFLLEWESQAVDDNRKMGAEEAETQSRWNVRRATRLLDVLLGRKKLCPTCRLYKTILHFHKQNQRVRGQGYCKACMPKVMQHYRRKKLNVNS